MQTGDYLDDIYPLIQDSFRQLRAKRDVTRLQLVPEKFRGIGMIGTENLIVRIVKQ